MPSENKIVQLVPDGLTTIEANDVCLRLGVVTSVNYDQAAAEQFGEVTLDVEVVGIGLLRDVYVQYHCEGYHAGLKPRSQELWCGDLEKIRQGWAAFQEGDAVILWKDDRHFGDGAANWTVIGFADGVPKQCMRALIFDVANSGITNDWSIVGPSGPYPDARLREAPEDNPGIMRPAERLIYNEYQLRQLQFWVIGGVPPFRKEIILRSLPHPCNFNATPGTAWYNVQKKGNPFYLVNGTYVVNSPSNQDEVSILRYNGIRTTPCAEDGDLAEVRITDKNGNWVSCWFVVRADDEAEPPPPPPPEPEGEISLSDTQMIIGADQEVTAEGCESGDYYWVITGGGTV